MDRGYATKPFRSPRRYCTTENECCEDIKSCQFFGKKWKIRIKFYLLRMFEESLDIRNVFSYNMKRISDVWPSKSIKMDCLKTAHHRISICVHLRDTIKRCRVRQVIVSITGRFFCRCFFVPLKKLCAKIWRNIHTLHLLEKISYEHQED